MVVTIQELMNSSNKIVIQINRPEDVIAIDKLCGTDYFYYYGKIPSDCAIFPANNTHCTVKYFEEKGFKIIQVKDILTKNLWWW